VQPPGPRPRLAVDQHHRVAAVVTGRFDVGERDTGCGSDRVDEARTDAGGTFVDRAWSGGTSPAGEGEVVDAGGDVADHLGGAGVGAAGGSQRRVLPGNGLGTGTVAIDGTVPVVDSGTRPTTGTGTDMTFVAIATLTAAVVAAVADRFGYRAASKRASANLAAQLS
jgi:hypothetical protein